MRTRAALSLALAAIAGVGAVPSATTAIAEPAAGAAGYLFHAQFDLEYDVDWVETSGDRLAACSYWTDDRGKNHVTAGSTTWIPGRLQIFSKPTRGRGWADLTATGARPKPSGVPPNAEVDVTRRLVQRGGTTPGCVPSQPPPFKVPPNDCGERSYKTKFGTLRADLAQRSGNRTASLRSLLDRPSREQPVMFVIRVTTPPMRVPVYRKCQTSRHAPEFPTEMPLALTNGNLRALKALEKGEKYSFGRSYSGLCEEDLPSTSSCYYKLDVGVVIRRWNEVEGDYP